MNPPNRFDRLDLFAQDVGRVLDSPQPGQIDELTAANRAREAEVARQRSAVEAHYQALLSLAGYLRVLSRAFIDAYRGSILNIHPSLLPAFPGLNVHRRTLAAGVKWTGCTVHFVDETLDGGPIIAQRKVVVRNDDTEESLSARILIQEHELYAEAVALVLNKKVKL